MLKGKSIDEIVGDWFTQLEVQVKEFERYASEVSVRDRALIESGNNVRRHILICTIDVLTESYSCLRSTLHYSRLNGSKMILIEPSIILSNNNGISRGLSMRTRR